MDELKKTYVAAILFGFIAGSVSVSVPLFLDSLGYSISNIGIILGVAALIGGLVGVMIGAHSDVVGRKKLLSGLGALHASCILILVPFKTVLSYVFSQAGAKFSSSTMWNLFLSRITDLTRKSGRGKHLGYYSCAFALSFAAAHFVAGSVLEEFGADALFLLISLTGLILAASVFSFREVKSGKERHTISLGPLKTKNGLANAIVSFMNGGQRSIIYGYAIYLFLAKTYSFTPAEVGFYSALFLGTWGASSYFLGRVPDRFGSMRTLVAGSLINGAIWITAAFLQSWEVFFTLMLAENVVYPLYGISTVKISSVLAHEKNVGRDIAIFGYCDTLGAISGVFIAGILAEISFSYVFLLRALFMILSAAVAYSFIKLREDADIVIPPKTEGVSV